MHEVASKHSPMAPLWGPDPVFENACSTRLHVQLQYLCLRDLTFLTSSLLFIRVS